MHERMKKLIFPFFILSMLFLSSHNYAQVTIIEANLLSVQMQVDKATVNNLKSYRKYLGDIAFDALSDGDLLQNGNYFYACAVDANLNRLVYGSGELFELLQGNYLLHQYGLGTEDISFNSPRGAALNTSTIYVSDTGNNRIVKLYYDASGIITNTEILNDFNQPMRMAMAPDGSAWVADKGNNRVVNTSSGAATGGWQFNSPEAVAVINNDEIMVVDTGNDRVVYINLSTSEWSSVDFPSSAHLVDVVINAETEAYIADDGMNLIHKIKLPNEYIASQSQGSPSCLTYGFGIIGVNNSFGNWTLASYNPVNDIKICDVETPSSTPIHYSVSANYPNPFNPSTTIQYQMPAPGLVKIRVFNMLGQYVTTLINESKSAGRHIVLWNGDDKQGNQIATGTYIIWLEFKNYKKAVSVTLLK